MCTHEQPALRISNDLYRALRNRWKQRLTWIKRAQVPSIPTCGGQKTGREIRVNGFIALHLHNLTHCIQWQHRRRKPKGCFQQHTCSLVRVCHLCRGQDGKLQDGAAHKEVKGRWASRLNIISRRELSGNHRKKKKWANTDRQGAISASNYPPRSRKKKPPVWARERSRFRCLMNCWASQKRREVWHNIRWPTLHPSASRTCSIWKHEQNAFQVGTRLLPYFMAN